PLGAFPVALLQERAAVGEHLDRLLLVVLRARLLDVLEDAVGRVLEQAPVGGRDGLGLHRRRLGLVELAVGQLRPRRLDQRDRLFLGLRLLRRGRGRRRRRGRRRGGGRRGGGGRRLRGAGLRLGAVDVGEQLLRRVLPPLERRLERLGLVGELLRLGHILVFERLAALRDEGAGLVRLAVRPGGRRRRRGLVTGRDNGRGAGLGLLPAAERASCETASLR